MYLVKCQPSTGRASLQPTEAELVSGYKVGGINPFGQIRALPTAIEAQAMAEALVCINRGRRGLQVRLDPRDAATLLKAIVAPPVS